MLLLEGGLPVLQLHNGQLAAQYLDEEVSAATCGFQHARVDALGLCLDQIEHGLNHPRRREHLPMVYDTLF